MEIDYADDALEKLETDISFDDGYDRTVVKTYRKRIQLIRSAPDERDFYALKSLHYEKLKGKWKGCNSMRINKQWRLITKIRIGRDGKVVEVIAIEDYH